MARARTIREEPAVRDAVIQAKQAHPRCEEAYEGLKWELARDPYVEGSMPIGGTRNPLRVYRQQGVRRLGIPAIEVLYVVPDDQHVDIVSVRFV